MVHSRRPLTHLPEPPPLPEGGGEPAVHPDPGRPPLAQLAGPDQARAVRGVIPAAAAAAAATRGHFPGVGAGIVDDVAPA